MRALTLLLTLVACTSTPAATPPEGSGGAVPAAIEEDAPSLASEEGVQPVDATRLVTLGGGLTEIVHALGQGEAIAATDSSSHFPADLSERATLGSYRRLSAEGVLAAAPSAVLATEGTGPPAALEQLEAAGVRVEVLPGADTPDQAFARMRAVAALLGVTEAGEGLVSTVQGELDAVAASVEGRPRPRVLFIYARGGGTMLVAGRDTSAESLVELAGGQLAAPDHEGFRPLTAEAVVAAQPDVVLLTTGGLQAMGGVDGVLQAPGLSATPAGQARHVVSMDDLLMLGFGPRLGEAARTLAQALHPSNPFGSDPQGLDGAGAARTERADR